MINPAPIMVAIKLMFKASNFKIYKTYIPTKIATLTSIAIKSPIVLLGFFINTPSDHFSIKRNKSNNLTRVYIIYYLCAQSKEKPQKWRTCIAFWQN